MTYIEQATCHRGGFADGFAALFSQLRRSVSSEPGVSAHPHPREERSGAPRPHVAALDSLRTLAVASVILYHVRPDAPYPGIAGRALDAIAGGGWCGVDLFFVLSGFLITGILVDAKGRPHFFRNFYLRRTLRIFPLYYAVLVVMLVVLPHVLDTRDPAVEKALHHQASLWTYSSNIDVFVNRGYLFNARWLHLTHLWSLAIEEQFYLVWPLLVFVLPRRGVAIVAGALVVASPIIRAALLDADVPAKVVYSFTPCRMDALAVGALLALAMRARPAWSPALARLLVATGALGATVVIGIAGGLDADAPAVAIAGYSFLALAFGGVVLAAALPGPVARALAARPLAVIGRYTYGIYLFHAILIPFAIEPIKARLPATAATGLALAIVLFVVSLAVAVASYHLFEERFLRLKERWTRA